MRQTIIAVAFALLLPFHANAWNARGHQFVADVAESLLSDRARDVVGRLLRSQGKEHLRDVAAWADQIRALQFPGQPSHEIRIPWDSDFVPKRDCAKRACALGILQKAIKALETPETNETARAVALNYIVHLIGDLHQPLHVSRDPSFSLVDFNGDSRKFHRIWDRDIADGAVTVSACGTLDTDPNYQSADLVKWVREIHSIAHDVYSELRTYPELEGIPQLPADYVELHTTLACRLLRTAGIRLALVINTAIDK